jgi:hypothetical protein
MALQFTLMGMGKALNQDDRRRAELLRVDTTAANGGIVRFHDIDRPTLRALVDEGFANPATNQNDAPPIGQFLGMLEQHPELRVGGYAVAMPRADYRVSIDSVCVDLDAVPSDRRAQVEALFAELATSATNTDPGAASLACWWT